MITISTRMPRNEAEKIVEMCKSRGISLYTWLLLLARRDLKKWEQRTVQSIQMRYCQDLAIPCHHPERDSCEGCPERR